MTILSQRISALRHERELTQSGLAELLTATRGAVAQWETGKSLPGLDSITRLAQIFEVSVDYLLGRSDIRNPRKIPAEMAGILDFQPELPLLLTAMFAGKGLRNQAQIMLYTGHALSAEELAALTIGASPLAFAEEKLVRFFRKFPLIQIREYFRVARTPLPQSFIDLESELREVIKQVRLSSDGSPAALEYVLQLAREIFTEED